MSEEIMVCPECDSPTIQVNVQTTLQGTGAATAYRCRNCRDTFDEPVTRKRWTVDCRAGPAGRIADKNTALATDGGQSDSTAAALIRYITRREENTELLNIVAQHIATLDDGQGNGAPVGAMIEAAAETHDGYSYMQICLAVYALAHAGDIYAPTETTVRLADTDRFDVDDTDIVTDGEE